MLRTRIDYGNGMKWQVLFYILRPPVAYRTRELRTYLRALNIDRSRQGKPGDWRMGRRKIRAAKDSPGEANAGGIFISDDEITRVPERRHGR